MLPGTGLQSASINLRSVNAPLTKSGTGAIAGWTRIGQQATSVSQQITVQASDIDPIDNKVHVRFIAAPVLDNPSHSVNEQPFFAIQLNNITTGRTAANPLFFQWNFASQPGTPWKNLTLCGAGTNPGCRTTYQYTDWQAFDIAPGNAFIHVGDEIEVVVIASGCSQGGHEGHVHLDDMHTTIPSGLWVTASGPASTTPGSNVTYTYTYTNNGNTPVNNVQVVANLPQGTPPLVAGVPGPVTLDQNTTFVSNTNPTTGSCTGSGPVTCTIGTLQPGQTGTFTVTFAIPGSWVTADDGTDTTGPVNNGNYPISGTGVTTLLGPLVQTALVDASAVSNLIANASGMPPTAVAGTPYTGSFTCTNDSNLSAAGDAPNASCDITNLPAGLVVSGCTISPSNTVWTQPATIPADETVTCDVTGTPTSSGAFTATVTANATNNSNSTSNSASAPITISASDMVAASSLPASAAIGAPYSGSFTCTNNSAVTATSVQCGISGLPNGVTVSSCSSPTHNPWVNGSSLPAHHAVTCSVSGTPVNLGSVTATVTTSANNQTNTSNDTSPTSITIGNSVADMVAASSLPTSATVSSPYTGSFTCTNNSAVTATSVQCGISGLPNGVAVSSCSSPTHNPWVNGSSLPAHHAVTCRISGTPRNAGSVTATVTTRSINQSNTSNDTRATTINVRSGGVADMVAAASLPAKISAFSLYSGSFTCTNNSSVTATSVQCNISGLPSGVKVTSCSSPSRNPWVNGSSLPAHQAITCRVSGKPTKLGNFSPKVMAVASNQSNTSNDIRLAAVAVSRPPVPATLNGSRVLSPAVVCCGRPVLLNTLGGVGQTTYKLAAHTGDARCVIGRSGSQNYLKMYGRNGSCTVVGTQNGITTLPLTIRTP